VVDFILSAHIIESDQQTWNSNSKICFISKLL